VEGNSLKKPTPLARLTKREMTQITNIRSKKRDVTIPPDRHGKDKKIPKQPTYILTT
jgi:hypothetical protein